MRPRNKSARLLGQPLGGGPQKKPIEIISLPLSQDHASVLVHGTCQIPDPVYKLVGSIVCFYIPLGVMLLTYYLTVDLLARQQQSLGTTGSAGWASGWLGQAPILRM